jgi:adenosylmethionine-8-amino-7-oxononanoate aminotransferase
MTMAETRFWHPFADMAAVAGDEFVLRRAEGVWVWDVGDRRYLDASASLWYSNVGHGRAEIADAVRDQLLELDAYSTFGDFTNERAEELTARLAGLAPVESRVFLTSGGGDSIETAGKLARQYWSTQGQPTRVHLIARTGGFHGTHGFGTSLGGIEANRAGWGPLMEHMSLVAWDSVDAVDADIRRVGPDNVAAMFLEPVMGAGGVNLPPAGYIEGVADICRSHGVLLVVDSVICAFGRLGSWFGVERWGIEPDMIVFAKGVTSGYQPLGGVVVSDAVAEPFWNEPGHFVRHGATYAGHPAACAAALANLDIIEREGLLARADELEGELERALAPLAEHPLVAEVRAGTGVMAAVELERTAIDAGVTPVAVIRRLRELGVLARPLATSVAVSPPLVIGAPEIALIARSIGEAIEALAPAHA